MRTINIKKTSNASGKDEYYTDILPENMEMLCTICGDLLAEKFCKIVANWNKACRKYKNVKLALSETNSIIKQIDKEILKLENSYSVIADILTKAAKDIEQLIGNEFFDSIITNHLNDLDHMNRINNSIKAMKFKKCLILKDSARCRSKIKSLAIQELFSEAKKIGLKYTGVGGRGKINPVVKFVSIISGIEDPKILDKYQRKYKKCAA